MADLTHRIAQQPLTADADGLLTGPCLAATCNGQRTVYADGTVDGARTQVVTSCDRCGRVEIEPAPGKAQAHPVLPGIDTTDG